jgi:hypothetical protein
MARQVLRAGELVYVGASASVQFAGDRSVMLRVIRVHDRPTYAGWIWLDGYVRHEALLISSGGERPAPGPCRSRVSEAGGSLTSGTRRRAASSPDNAGTAWYCQTGRVRLARRKGVRKEPVVKLLKRDRRLKSGGYGSVNGQASPFVAVVGSPGRVCIRLVWWAWGMSTAYPRRGP